MKFVYNGKSALGGIYRIVNLINGRLYIGSAKFFRTRGREHRRTLENGKHSNKFLQADFDKCGADSFVFEVLEVVEGTREERLLVEDRYLGVHFDSQQNCYNLRPKASSPQEKPSSTEDTKKKRSLAMKKRWADPEYRKRLSQVHKELIAKGESRPPSMSGRTHSTEAKQRIGKAHKNKTVTKKTRKKIGLASTEVWQRLGYREKMSLVHRKPK